MAKITDVTLKCVCGVRQGCYTVKVWCCRLVTGIPALGLKTVVSSSLVLEFFIRASVSLAQSYVMVLYGGQRVDKASGY